MILEPADVAPPHLLGQAVDDLDAGEVALVDRAVEGLARKSLLMDGAVRVAVEEAAELVLELADARVHEMTLDRIVLGERDVVAALHHAGAAAFAEQALDRDGDVEIRIGLLGMQRREQPGPAGAEDENVRLDLVHARAGPLAPSFARMASRRPSAAALTSACSEPPCESIVTSSGPKPLMRNFHRLSG